MNTSKSHIVLYLIVKKEGMEKYNLFIGMEIII